MFWNIKQSHYTAYFNLFNVKRNVIKKLYVKSSSWELTCVKLSNMLIVFWQAVRTQYVFLEQDVTLIKMNDLLLLLNTANQKFAI